MGHGFSVVIISSLFHYNTGISCTRSMLLGDFCPTKVRFTMIRSSMYDVGLAPSRITTCRVANSSGGVCQRCLGGPGKFTFFHGCYVRGPISGCHLVLSYVRCYSDDIVTGGGSCVERSPGGLLALVYAVPNVLLALCVHCGIGGVGRG